MNQNHIGIFEKENGIEFYFTFRRLFNNIRFWKKNFEGENFCTKLEYETAILKMAENSMLFITFFLYYRRFLNTYSSGSSKQNLTIPVWCMSVKYFCRLYLVHLNFKNFYLYSASVHLCQIESREEKIQKFIFFDKPHFTDHHQVEITVLWKRRIFSLSTCNKVIT